MTKIVLKFVFLSVLVFSISGLIGKFTLEDRKGHEVWLSFYDEPKNSLDIIFMGSSLGYSSFNPLIFNSVLNLNSYNLGTATQDIKQIYYNLDEVLEYQKPSMVIVEAYSLDINDESEEERLGFLFENLDYQKMSFRKLVAANNQFISLKNKINAVSPLIRNHNEWSNIEFIQDNIQFEYERNRFLGYKLENRQVKQKVLEKAIDKAPDEYILPEENKAYFRKLSNLCKTNDIKLLVVRAPVLLSNYKKEYYDRAYQSTKELCESEDIEYIDYNMQWKNLLFDNSYFSDAIHLNYKGAIKISEHLASQLKNENLIKSNNFEEKQFYEPEDFIYSNRFNSKLQTIFSGNHTITDNIIIKEVYTVKARDDEYSLIVKLDERLDFDEMSDYSFGYYFYPVDSQVQLLETEKDLKRKYASLGDYGAPMYFKNNYYVTLRSYKMQPNQFKKIKIQPYNKSGNLGESLIVENVVFK